MYSSLPLDGVELWHVAGWMMVHYLWLGTLVGVVAAGCRLMLRRASPNVRYVAAAASLVVLTALPLAIAGWLAMNPPPIQGGLRRAQPSWDRGESFSASDTPQNARFLRDATAGSELDAEFDALGTELARETARLQSNVEANAFAAEPSSPALLSSLQASLRGRGSLTGTLELCVAYLPWIWFIGTPLTLVLLATGIVGTERLRRAGQPVAAGPLTEMGARLARSLRVGRRVAIAVCDRVCAPVLVGILRPIILLPPAALTGWSPDEIEMVLLHELAHVRRWDNLVNLLQRLVESLLFFHPAVWLVSNWMRRDREACCDALVVTCTKRPHAYAELLVALAAQMPRSVLFHPAASSAMAARPLRNRIRRILQMEDDAMLVTGKSFALVLAGLVTAATFAVLYLPARGQAEESATEITENSNQSEEHAESADAAKEAGANETQVDSPTDQVAFGAEGDWLLAENFSASQKEREIAKRAWKELGFKAVPLTEAELKEVRRGGFQGGLKLLGLEEVMNTQGPLILTHIQSKRLATGVGDFAALERALDVFASQPPGELLVLQGIKPRGGIFQYAVRRSQEKSAESTPSDARDEVGQAKSESDELAEDAGPEYRVEVEGVPVGDEDVMVVRGPKDDVNAFVKRQEAGEKREPQNEPRVLATIPPDRSLDELFRAADKARAQNLYVDIRFTGNGTELVVVQEPTEADWPAMLGNPPRKDRAIADKAWQRLGLKLAPASHLESTEFTGRRTAGPVKILGGNVPEGLPLPAFLRRIGGNNLDSFDDLHTWLINEEDKRPEPVKVYSFANGHEYLFEAQPVEEERLGLAQGPTSKFPSLEDQKLADLAWQMLQLELEPAGEEELKHIRALGYQGGVMVAGKEYPDDERRNDRGIQRGDILVGLHVWPTTSLNDVAAILQRDDLADLNPLKFYVVRGDDAVITGRISVRSRSAQPSGLSELDAAERRRKNSTAPGGNLSAYAWQSRNERPAANENEIKVLQDHIKTLQSQFDRIDALYKSSARGGRASTRALAAYELAVAKGELARMQGQRDQAIKSFHQAQSQAEEAFRAMSADYEAGNTTYDVLLLASKNLAEIKRRIIQLEQERTAPNRAAAARRGDASTISSTWPAGEAEKQPATSVTPAPNQPSSTSKRPDSGVMIVGESQAALNDFMRLASSPPPGDSISVLRKIVQREKQKYDRLAELAKNGRVTAAEVETQKADYEISLERLRQAERALEYHRAQVAMASAEYEAALESKKLAPRSISESELRKLQLKVQAAEAMYKTLAE